MIDDQEQSVSTLPEAVAIRMREILARHASDYRKDLPRLVEQMQAHAAAVDDADRWREALPVLKREAHDMKGQAATFGYPLVSSVAQSVCRLLEHASAAQPDYAPTVRAHMDVLEHLLEKEDPELVATTVQRAQALTHKD